MKKEKLPLWIRFGNLVEGFFGLFDSVAAFLVLLITFLVGILAAPFDLIYQVAGYSFGVRGRNRF